MELPNILCISLTPFYKSILSSMRIPNKKSCPIGDDSFRSEHTKGGILETVTNSTPAFILAQSMI